MKNSIWSDSVALPHFPALNKDIKTDVLIIGGGLCGLMCAYYLHKASIDYVLIEANRIASGITKNTTAKITSQHGLIYAKLISTFGKEKARMYLTANQNALSEYEKLCQIIDCDFEKKDAFTYSMTDRAKIEAEVKAVNSLGFDADFVQEPELPLRTRGAIRFKNQAQFHPLKFIAHIARDLNIYENTFAREFTPDGIITNCGRIKAEKIIVATHFPFINKHGSYFIKLYQHRSYVSAYENCGALNGMYVDESKNGFSLRGFNDLLLIGGGGHRTGKRSSAWQGIHDFARIHYPKAKLCCEWAAQDCMSLDSVPYIGRYSKNTPDMYVATGFNKWGITSSVAAATILTDAVQGRKNDCADVFSPQRSILRPQLLVNGFESAINMLIPTPKRCPHLGCALKWNKAEHTWDCPCHGSRFDKDGKIIDNPATGNADV